MQEREFVRRRREDWERLAELVEKARRSGPASLPPESLAAIGPLYRRAVSDLSLAKTRFPTSPTTGYLNQLVARAHTLLYGGGQLSWRGIGRFFTRTFPRAVREQALLILLMAAFFTVGAIFGAWNFDYGQQVLADLFPFQDFEGLAEQPRTATGDGSALDAEPDRDGAFESDDGTPAPSATEMDAISDGVLGSDDTVPEARFTLEEHQMAVFSSYIMVNNIRVCLLAFALGITFGVGTLWVLWSNGVVLGYVAVAFGADDPLEFWSLILPHGVLELPAIFVCAAAGWSIGWSLLRPGEHGRLEAARRAARRGLRLVGGCVALLVVAALIEGFFTPSSASAGMKLAVATLTFLLFLYYLYRAGRGVEDGEPA